MAIIGSKNALRRLNREINKIEGRTVQGLLSAATIVKVRSQDKTPVDEGNLKASHYIARRDGINQTIVEVGCTADYAVPVHENLNARHTVGQAKFLEAAIVESESDILDAVRRRARIK